MFIEYVQNAEPWIRNSDENKIDTFSMSKRGIY